MAEPQDSLLDKLRVALQLVDTLRTENDAYKQNFDCLKNAHERLQERHESLVHELETSNKEKLAVEAMHAEAAAHFKAQLDEKSKDLEAVRAAVPNPKDIEILRLRTVQEVELQNEKRWKALHKDTERYRTLYYALRRDHEIAKADIDRERAQITAKLSETEAVYQDEMSALETRMAELRTCLDTSNDPKRLRELQRDNTELQLRVSSMLPELEELRAEREKLHLDMEQASRLHIRKLADEVAHGKALQAEKDGLAVKLATAASESAETLRTLDHATEQVADLTKELDRTRSKLDEAAHLFKTQTSDAKLAHLKSQTQLQNKISELKEKITGLESQLKTGIETIQTLRARVASSEKDTLEKCRQAREEEWAAKAQLESEKSQLEAQLTTLKRTQFDAVAALDICRREAQAEITELRRAAREASAKCDASVKAASDAAAELERARAAMAKLETAVSDAEGRAGGLAAETEAKGREAIAMRADVEKLETDLQSLRSQLAQATEKAKEDATEYRLEIERIKAHWSRNKTSLSQKLEATTADRGRWEDKAHELEDLLAKSQKLFTSKVALVRGRAREYKDEINKLRKSLEVQTKRADAVAREIHQRQTDFLGLLRGEGVIDAAA
ncbi:Centrosomal protein of 83 kDa [Geranomyces variabilis]|uniref:Centrosomal protein of 83 kDa n=1 Tax=Geranomyces variabilis TaxID=109894 RepID=A0AAD5TKV1_9FUNG|nr:Centrosomal protein of 83 kDa [Geranomyces variabilis]